MEVIRICKTNNIILGNEQINQKMTKDELRQLRKDLIEKIKIIDKRLKHDGKGKYLLEVTNPETEEKEVYFCNKLEEISRITGRSIATVYRVLNTSEEEREKNPRLAAKNNFTVKLSGRE